MPERRARRRSRTISRGDSASRIDQARAGRHRIRETPWRIGGEYGGLDQDQFLQVTAFPQGLGVVADPFRQGLVHEPQPEQRVIAGENQERMEPGLFTAGRPEQGEVEAGGEPPLDDGSGLADLLSRAFEARGRQDVGDPQGPPSPRGSPPPSPRPWPSFRMR